MTLTLPRLPDALAYHGLWSMDRIEAAFRKILPTFLTFRPATAQDITAAGTAILARAALVLLTADASYTLTAAPTIADGEDGQLLLVVNVDTVDTITLQDQGTLASSNLRLSAATIGLAPRDSILLLYNLTIADWIQIGQTNVI